MLFPNDYFKSEDLLIGQINAKLSEPPPKTLLKLGFRRLEELNNKEIERKKIIEEKARTNLLGLSVGFPLVFTGGSFMFKVAITVSGCFSSFVLKSLLASGIAFILLGGWFSLRALRIRMVYSIYLHDELEFIKIPNKRLRIKKYCDELWRSIEVNLRYTMIQSNYVDGSYVYISIGIICLASYIFYVFFGLDGTTKLAIATGIK